MTGIFSLRQPFWPSVAMLPLLAYTVWWAFVTNRDFGPLSEYLAISSICEVDRGGEAEDVVGVRDENQVTRSESSLSHRRYAVNDETMYVAPSDKRTDYSQPPMSNFYDGVLNTGRRRYAHPALSGSLPTPWLPAMERPEAFGDGAAKKRGVVLSLRRKVAKKLRRKQAESADEEAEDTEDRARSESLGLPDGWATGRGGDVETGPSRQASTGTGGNEGFGTGSQLSATPSNPWRDPTPQPDSRSVRKKASYDPASGVIVLPEEENVWGDDGSDSGDEGQISPGGAAPESPSTYFHHPERRQTVSESEGLLAGTTVPRTDQTAIP